MLSAAHRRLLCCLAPALLCAAAALAQSGQDVPDATIPLAPLGYEPPPLRLLLAEGYTVSSLQYVDAHHLLFTYNTRSLIHRMPDDSPDDSPQNVAAVLMELPSGKVLARTEWRLHDHAQYLWPVGEGTFLLRLGRELRLLTPLVERNPDAILQGKLLLMLPGQASLIEISPDGRMMLLEADTTAHPAPDPAAISSSAGTPAAPAATASNVPAQHVTDVQFLEIDLSQQAQGRILVNRVGHITAPSVLGVPLVHDGYVHAQEIYPDDWGLIYTRLDGASTILGDVISTCLPAVEFLSNREMLVDTCNSDDTAIISSVVTLDKKELWQHTFSDSGTEPAIHTTPASGRFAVSRVLVNGSAAAAVGVLSQDEVRMQRIDVMDIANGALVASVAASPPERTGQNFALSADGRHLAVLQGSVIALYDLAAPVDFPAPKIKPKDIVFAAAPDGATAVPAITIKQAGATATTATGAPAPPPAAIEVPLNVDERRTPPSLLTPEEKHSVEQKRDKEVVLPPPVPPQKQQPQQQ